MPLPLPVFFSGHCKTKNKDIHLIFCSLVLLYRSILCIPVYGFSKNDLLGIYFKEGNFDFGGSKTKTFEIPK